MRPSSGERREHEAAEAVTAVDSACSRATEAQRLQSGGDLHHLVELYDYMHLHRTSAVDFLSFMVVPPT